MHAFRRYGVRHFDLWGVWWGDIFEQFDADGDFMHHFGGYRFCCHLQCERRGNIFNNFDHYDAEVGFVHYFRRYGFRH